MAKMEQHRLIAKDPEIKARRNKINDETVKVFKAGNLITGLKKTWHPVSESSPTFPGAETKVVTTVVKRLNYARGVNEEAINQEAAKNEGNMQARADLVVDGKVLRKDLPATTLLSLETQLRALRAIYDLSPTLDLSLSWEAVGEAVFRNGPHNVDKHERLTLWEKVVEETEHHPAQVKEQKKDVKLGYMSTTHFSGAVHPGDKAAMLGQIDKLIVAAKDAREVANKVPVDEEKDLGKVIFDFIHAPLDKKKE